MSAGDLRRFQPEVEKYYFVYLSAGTVITKDAKEPNNRVLLGGFIVWLYTPLPHLICPPNSVYSMLPSIRTLQFNIAIIFLC